jgi:hypothetical protein
MTTEAVAIFHATLAQSEAIAVQFQTFSFFTIAGNLLNIFSLFTLLINAYSCNW